MVSSSLIAALGAIPLAFAQTYPSGNATGPAAPSGTGSPAAVQTVAVGQNGLTFSPDTITAKAGDRITFQFFPKNHSVVQADFNNPCNPSDGGIFSGFVPTPAPGPSNQTFTIEVKDDKPVWLYCSALLQSPHCAAGMVAVINPPAEGPNTLDAFREAAKKTTTSTSPAAPNGGVDPNSPPSNNPGNPSGNPDQPGAASSLVVSGGALGVLMAVFAGLL